MDVNYNFPIYEHLEESLRGKFGSGLQPLGKIADVICGPFGSAIKNTDYQDFGIPLLRITNISKDGYMKYDDIVYISEELGNSLLRTQVSSGDIVISQRGTLGQCAVVDDTFDKFNISANIIAIKNIKGLSSAFIRDYILSNIGQTLLERNMSGQVQKKVTTQDIANLLIPVNCNEAKLTAIMKDARAQYILKIRQADELLAEGKQYLLSVLNIVKPTYRARLCSAVSLKDIIQGVTFGVEYYHPERIAVINALRSNSNFELKRLSEMVKFCRNTVDSGSCSEKYLGLAGVESQSGELSGIKEDASGQAFSYQAGDVLYGRLRPYLNKVLLAECSGICSTEFHVMRVLNPNKLLPEYLAAIMLSDLVVAQTKHMMTGNTHPRVSNDDIKNLYIPIPNIEIQKSIVAELSIRKAEARKLRATAEQEWLTAKAEFEKELLGG